MNMHKNARTTKHSRVLMIKRIEDGWHGEDNALAAGVSVRTVYKWLAHVADGTVPATNSKVIP